MSIIMADGSTKPVQDIRVGDLVTSWDDKSKTVTTGKVIAFQSKLAPEYYILNDKIEATPTHPFMVNGKWTAVAAIEPGDVIRSVDGKNIKITSKKHIKKEVAIFNFTVEKFHNYYVEGLLSHNFGFINIGFFARNFVKSP
ncbi:MAG: hypothetical protein D6719_13620 [Candidatus Dadabacteria bacterium]|nr:MAG: hypothetical protein D6719_13620 [Candidatus Dadabacteria bacterium]